MLVGPHARRDGALACRPGHARHTPPARRRRPPLSVAGGRDLAGCIWPNAPTAAASCAWSATAASATLTDADGHAMAAGRLAALPARRRAAGAAAPRGRRGGRARAPAGRRRRRVATEAARSPRCRRASQCSRRPGNQQHRLQWFDARRRRRSNRQRTGRLLAGTAVARRSSGRGHDARAAAAHAGRLRAAWRTRARRCR